MLSGSALLLPAARQLAPENKKKVPRWTREKGDSDQTKKCLGPEPPSQKRKKRRHTEEKKKETLLRWSQFATTTTLYVV